MAISQYSLFQPDDTSEDLWEDCNKCMCKLRKQNFNGVGDILLDGQIQDGRTDGWTDGRMETRTDELTEPK